ncbi:MAG TPA: hypothetical protein VF519_15730 [Mycobacteriales bacterium]|jgi:hypothetical protein
MKLRPLVAVLALPLTMASPAASAPNADVFVLTGSGTFTPGFGLYSQPQSVAFTGTITSVGTRGILGTYSCGFSGTVVGTIAVGTGTMYGSCGPLQLGLCQVAYVAGLIAFAGLCASTGAPAAFTCVAQYANINPTTRYYLMCEGASVTAP